MEKNATKPLCKILGEELPCETVFKEFSQALEETCRTLQDSGRIVQENCLPVQRSCQPARETYQTVHHTHGTVQQPDQSDAGIISSPPVTIVNTTQGGLYPKFPTVNFPNFSMEVDAEPSENEEEIVEDDYCSSLEDYYSNSDDDDDKPEDDQNHPVAGSGVDINAVPVPNTVRVPYSAIHGQPEGAAVQFPSWNYHQNSKAFGNEMSTNPQPRNFDQNMSMDTSNSDEQELATFDKKTKSVSEDSYNESPRKRAKYE